MNNQIEPGLLLEVIVPVSDMAGKLGKLASTLVDGVGFGINFILIHDYKDAETGIDLDRILRKLPASSLKIIEGRFGSPGAARNAGLAVANREWIAFWDSDDLPLIENFLRMLEKAKTQNSDIALGSFKTISDLDSSILSEQIISTNQKLASRQIAASPGIWRFAFKKELIKESRFPNLRMAEDQVFLTTLNLSERRMFLEQEFVYTYFSGAAHHLTSKSIVMGDLLEAARITKESLPKQDEENYFFVLELLTRQLVSAARRGKLLVRINAIVELMISLFGKNLFQFRAMLGILFRLKSKN